MKKKKERAIIWDAIYFWKWQIFVVLLVVALFVLFAISRFDTFNPEEDVCEEWDIRCYTEMNTGEIDCTPTGHEECKSWRSKTLCEKDPNAEGCVCDEWVSRNKTSYTPKTIETKYRRDYWRVEEEEYYDCLSREDLTPRNSFVITVCGDIEIIEDRIAYWETQHDIDVTITEYRDCIKAHEPNECERNEEGWVWDDMVPIDCIKLEGEDTTTGFHNNMTRRECSRCRPKTIQELSCEELKEAYITRGVRREFMEFIERCGK